MIQDVITRMANNSFKLKGWVITLVAGFFALAGKDTEKSYFLVVYIPIIIFWGLDAYYLLQERLFRILYNKAITMSEEEIDFSMDTSAPEFRTKKTSFCNCLLSKTILWFYFPLSIISIGIIIITQI